MTLTTVLALCGSQRRESTSMALLRAIAACGPAHGIEVTISDATRGLPIFSPDDEGDQTPPAVKAMISAIATADALLIASPEYIRDIPGGLKNVLDWLVSGEALIEKPIFLAHASHRGDDMLESLRRVLATVSTRFADDVFLRLPLMKKTPDEIAGFAAQPEIASQIAAFAAAMRAAI